MKRSRIAHAATALLYALLLTSCSDRPDEGAPAPSQIGSLHMALRLPSGAQLDALSVSLANPSSGYSRTGEVAIGSAEPTFTIGAIPVGTGYRLLITATTSDSLPCSSSPVLLDIAAQQTTLVNVALRCGNQSSATASGNVRIDVGVEQDAACAEVDGLSALPSAVIVTNALSLEGFATLPDATFAWSVTPATGGVFSASTASSSSFLCSVVGTHQVTLSVTSPNCAARAATIPIVCEPQVSGCGDGVVQGLEQCDDGNQLDDDGCTNACQFPPTCDTCRSASCRSFEGDDVLAGCLEAVNAAHGANASDPLFIQQCKQVVGCARRTGCAYTADTQAAACYCGSASLAECATNGPAADAPCVSEWLAAARATSNAEVQQRLTDLSYPSGWANKLLRCDLSSCSSPATGDCTEPELCAVVDGLTASPLAVAVGFSLELEGFATGLVPPDFEWSVSPQSGGTFANATSAATTFTCVEVGFHDVVLRVQSGGTCAPSFETVPVECETP